MSAVPRSFPYDTGFAGVRMSADEFLNLGETQERYQLFEGVVMRMSRPTMLHQAFLKLLLRQLLEYERTSGATCFPEIDWKLGAQTVYSPDLSCFRPGRNPVLDVHLSEVPDLIIEILSPGNKAFDLTEKKDDYDRAGVPEYWAIDPKDARLRCYRRQDGMLVEVPVKSDLVASASLPGFTLDLRPLKELAAKV